MYKSRGYIYWYADPSMKEARQSPCGHRPAHLRRGQVLSRPPGGDGQHVHAGQGHSARVRAERRGRPGHGGGQEEPPEDAAARVLQDRRGAGLRRPEGREEDRHDGQGDGDLAQRDSIRRGILGARRCLRAVQFPDAELPRPRRDPGRSRRRSEKSRATTICRTPFPGSWTRTRAWARPSSTGRSTT